MTEPQFTVDFSRKPWRYMLGDEGMPGVTDVLQDLGFIDTEYYTEEGKRRGADVHALCQFLDENDYDPKEAERLGLAGYVESWRKLRDRLNMKFLGIEVARYHPLYRYAGTLDRHVLIGSWEWVLDIKTGDPEDWHGYQTGGYDNLLPPYERGLRKRGAAHLKQDGSIAVLKPHEDFDDPNYFLSFLTTHRKRREHGISNGR